MKELNYHHISKYIQNNKPQRFRYLSRLIEKSFWEAIKVLLSDLKDELKINANTDRKPLLPLGVDCSQFNIWILILP